MLTDFHDHIHTHKLFAKTDRVLVAVSGGRDSMVLADLFLQSDYDFAVAHANFQLRGEESENDEALVKAWATENEVPYFHQQFDTHEMAQRLGMSTQMTARELRYAWFEELCIREGFAVVATAHHRQDALESTLLNLTRGTGHTGIVGIAPRAGIRVRPLLFATRQHIDAYAGLRNVSWREDSTNAETKYRRNYVRHEVLPRLQTLNPSLLDTYGATYERLQGAEQLLDGFINEWLEYHLVKEAPDVRLPLSPLLQLPAPAVVLYHWLRPLGFTYSVIADAVKHLHGIPGRYWDSSTHRLLIDREELWLSPQATAQTAMSWPSHSNHLTISAGYLTRHLVPLGDVPPTDPTEAWLDPWVLEKNWRVRPWQQGDWFVPLGMKGRKKLSDFLIDRKIPLNLKSRIWVLEIDGQVAWVIGHRVDDRHKCTFQTQSVVHLSFNADS